MCVCGTHQVWDWDLKPIYSAFFAPQDEAQTQGVTIVAFSPDGTRVANARMDSMFSIVAFGADAAPTATLERTTLTRCAVQGVRVAKGGGVAMAVGSMSMINSTLVNCSATASDAARANRANSGGGVFVDSSTFNIVRTDVSPGMCGLEARVPSSTVSALLDHP